MTPEERESVRELIGALPACEAFLPGFDGDKCGRPATWTVNDSYADSGDREHYCDAHAEDRKKRTWEELPHAPALRKVQAMLDNEKNVAASACDASAVFTMLAEDGVQFATFTHDARGRRIVEVDLPLRGRATFVIHANDTTETLVETIRRYNAQAKL